MNPLTSSESSACGRCIEQIVTCGMDGAGELYKADKAYAAVEEMYGGTRDGAALSERAQILAERAAQEQAA